MRRRRAAHEQARRRAAGRVAGTRARGPTPEPAQLGRHLLAVGGVLLLLASVALAPHAWDRGRAALRSEPFQIHQLRIRGLDRLEPDAIREALALAPGVPLVSLDVPALEDRLSAHPWIASAQLVRVPPDALHVRVREQVPLAVVQAGEPPTLHVVNEAGVAFAPASEPDAARLVHVALAEPAAVGVPDPRVQEALRLAASLPERGLEVPRQVRMGLPAREQSAELRLRGLAPAIWIERARHAEQVDRLARLLAANLQAASEARLIDLRFEGRAVLWAGE